MPKFTEKIQNYAETKQKYAETFQILCLHSAAVLLTAVATVFFGLSEGFLRWFSVETTMFFVVALRALQGIANALQGTGADESTTTRCRHRPDKRVTTGSTSGAAMQAPHGVMADDRSERGDGTKASPLT